MTTDPNDQTVEQLTRIANALERLANDFDHTNRHSAIHELMRHIDIISQKHR